MSSDVGISPRFQGSTVDHSKEGFADEDRLGEFFFGNEEDGNNPEKD